MKLHELNHQLGNEDLKLHEIYALFKKLLIELEKRELPDEIIIVINADIDEINSAATSGIELKKLIKLKLRRILKLLEKKLKLVPKNYYRSMWMVLGMVVYGLPIGTSFGISLGNMAFIGIGLPMGLAIGIGVGDAMDKKAIKEGRQLDLEVKY
jgi:hypothetical protein